MKRSKKHKKHEKPGSSRPPRNPEKQEVDLNYYVKDRVELLQQTFSILKPREIKDMMPKCLRHLPLNELKELCLSELLGISSKRLYATLAGASPPSDTESSSDSDQPNFDAMSLESISSDDAVLSQQSSNGASKKKCKGQESRKGKKDKGKGKERKKARDKSNDHSKAAERAGLTILEMLELQARAQAIKSQLRAEQLKMSQPTSTITSAEAMVSDADDDVEIKEEPLEIVELMSSEDEKPDVKQLQQLITDQLTQEAHSSKPDEAGQSITMRNNLTIIVPTPKVTKKIKLNRKKSTPIVNQTEKPDNVPEIANVPEKVTRSADVTKNIQPNNENKDNTTKPIEPEPNTTETLQKKKPKKKKNKKKKMAVRKDSNAEVSDHDEISLQLSDSEKMDLLEDFDRKSNDEKSSEDSTDSDNSKQSEPEMSSTFNAENKDQRRIIEDISIKDNTENEVTTTVCDEDIPTTETVLDSDNKEGRVIDTETRVDTSTLRDVGGEAANQAQCPPDVDIVMDSHIEDAQVKSSEKIETKNSEDDASGNDIQSTEEKESHKKKKSKKKKAKKTKKS